MLILQRKKNESIMINDNIHLSILDIGSDYVKLAIDAPKNVPILRSELLAAAKVNQEASTIELDSIHSLQSFLINAEKKE